MRCWCGREAKEGKPTCGYHLPADDPAKAAAVKHRKEARQWRAKKYCESF